MSGVVSDFDIVVVGAVQGNPVVGVSGVVVVIERVVETLVNVALSVDLVLVQVSVHVDVSETILQLGVVVVRDGREGIEQIGINLSGLGHIFPLLLLGLLLTVLHVRLHNVEVNAQDAGVYEEVKAIAHTAE